MDHRRRILDKEIRQSIYQLLAHLLDRLWQDPLQMRVLSFAPDYGIPQRRTRLLIMCVRQDVFKKYGFPEEPEASFKNAHRSIEWAIGDLIDVTDNSIPNQFRIS